MRRIARTAADGVGAREWLEMGGEKKSLAIGELGCGRQRTANGCGELRGRLRTVWVPAYMGLGFAKYLQQFWELLSPVVSMMYVSYILY